MRVRYAKVAIIGLVGLALGGCGLIPIGPDPNAPKPELRVTVVEPLTAILDAREFGAAQYEWDFGDGSPVLRTTKGLVQHTYQKRGRYAALVYMQSADYMARNGSGPAIGSGAVPGSGNGLDSAYAVVDLQGEGPQAVIIIMSHPHIPVSGVYAWTPIIFWGEASSDPAGQGLAYWWEAVRWDKEQDKPIPPPPLVDGTPRSIQWMRSTEKNWYIKEGLWGPAGCSPVPWTYRIRLRVTDAFGRTHEAVKFLEVW